MVFRKKKLKFLFLFLLLIPILFIQPSSMESDKNKVVYKTQSMLGEIKVVDRGVHRILLVDGAVQSWVARKSFESSVGFADRSKFAFFVNPEIKDALVLGLGSGGLTNEFGDKFNINVDTVEIDENIIRVAKEYFGFEGDVFVGDARRFIKNSDKKYDAIFFDVSVGDAFPAHMYTKESFSETKMALQEGGILVVHMGGLIDSLKIRSLYKTIDSVFNNVFVIKSGDSASSGIAFFATDWDIDKNFIRENIKAHYPLRKGEREAHFYIMDNDWFDSLPGPPRQAGEASAIVITDNYNPLDLWQIDTMEAWREYSLNYFGDVLAQ